MDRDGRGALVLPPACVSINAVDNGLQSAHGALEISADYP
jgi:hypothetical protein